MDKFKNKVICIDFDGTIIEWDYPHIRKAKKGVKEALEKLKSLGFEIHILSCRTDKSVHPNLIDRLEHIQAMKKFLDENNIPYDQVLNENKPPAFAYIDDRGIGYRDNWENVIKEVEMFLEKDLK